MLALLALLACTPAEPPPPPAPTRATLDGVLTWDVDFDADAEASGLVDCSYARQYSGVEDRSAPWSCAGCESSYLADIAMVEGWNTCYDLISDQAPQPTEWIGFGGGSWFRYGTERGPAVVSGADVAVEQVTEPSDASVGTLSFHISGTFTLGEAEGDVMNGFEPPEVYACGWPRANPAPFTGEYLATVGDTLPDGWMRDACDEPVRLHDFAGKYLLVEISAIDCPPCRAAASEETAFVDGLTAEGLDVEVLTLLAPSLNDTAGTPTQAQLQAWIDTFGLRSPVLADRVWGLSVVEPTVGADFGYPTFVLVSPTLEVLAMDVGFGGYDTFGDLIRAHAGG